MPKILNFQSRQKAFEIRNKTATSAEIILYGAIGSSWFEDSISAKQFSDQLKALDPAVNQIDLRINSPGGDVFDGVAIYNRLIQHPAKITCYIDGICASIASIIAMAGDEVIMGEGALMMVHLPWTMAYGNRSDLENIIMRLMDVEAQMTGIYSKCTGLPRNEIQAMLEAETWMDATQAVENGFADSTIAETMPVAASLLTGAKWINKMPSKIKTQDDVVKNEIESLKNKISGILARK